MPLMPLIRVINPGATDFCIPDLAAFEAGLQPDEQVYVDLGAGYVVPLDEVMGVAMECGVQADLAMLETWLAAQPGA